MANTWFRFKKFTIHQDKAAMKVGTDGVLLGAWTDMKDCNSILDVGTGTGLLSLMAAQKNNEAGIFAIDIDEDAAQQAFENFQISSWNDRISAIHSSFKDFVHSNNNLFDLVICNPPYFRNAFKSTNLSRNIARHSDTLPYTDLILNSYKITNSKGRLAVVIPFAEEEEFIREAKKMGFYLKRLTHVKPTPQKDVVRSLIELSKEVVPEIKARMMIIEDKGRHGYSDEYIKLTHKFYLSF